MTARAEAAIFWPGITHDIHQTRATCSICNRMAPSQAALPPTQPTPSEYPFQCICLDYFHYKGHSYLVIVDRYTNWPIVEKAKEGSRGLVDVLRRTFATYGIPDELASDGGPEFTAHDTTKFLQDWRVHHRLSSVAFPHGNCRAEVAVKTVKRIISGNVGGDGNLNIDTFQRAILQYRNSPDPATRQSPASCLFGRPTKDLIPILPGKYHPHQTWRDNISQRESALRQRHSLAQDRWAEHTKTLTPLQIGDRVRVQNQTGNYPTKWDRTGTVVEVKQFHQYQIRVDGSGRLTLRNRKFLRRFTPANTPTVRRSILEDLATIPGYLPPLPKPTDAPTLPLTVQTTTPPILTTPRPPPEPEVHTGPATIQPPLPISATPARTQWTSPPMTTPTVTASPKRTTPRAQTTETPQPLRRSQRPRKPPDWLF